MQTIHKDLAHQLEWSAVHSRLDWEQANSMADSARKNWEQHRHWVAALVDHEPLEEISSLFEQLALCQSNHQQEDFAAVCLRLASICTMLSESHSPYWWNLL
jgi:hypothetical protein